MPGLFGYTPKGVLSTGDTPVGSSSGQSSPGRGDISPTLNATSKLLEAESSAEVADKLTPPPRTTNTSLDALQSAEQRNVLNIVDSLRQCGLEGILSLPQLVVCGDQSSGKSSVLEAITEIPFPRKEQLCTRFATEIVLRRAATSSISTSIIPDKARPNDERKMLEAFEKTITDFDELPSLIESATEAMGITGKGDGAATRAFARDVLSIEISGPGRPQLTLVDLPGLIHSENKYQSQEDVKLVYELVDEYISNPRTIILPIISAKNDYANQVILKRARDVDPEGNRTLGIITKPDNLHPGSENEAAFVALAKNKDISFKLGWHILKNRGFKERNYSFQQRNNAETSFFKKGAWAELSRDVVGIESLRTRLSDLLFKHIKKELPKLRQDLEEKLKETYKELEQMGEKRTKVSEQRHYLMKISMEFYNIAKASVNGHYEAEYFSHIENFSEAAHALRTRRLRAMIQHLNIKFAAKIRKEGHKYKFEGHTIRDELSNEEEEVDNEATTKEKGIDDDEDLTPRLLTKKQTMAWIKDCLNRSRGKELAGNFNPLLIGELFWEQSERWKALAKEYSEDISLLCSNFVAELLREICLPDVLDQLQSGHVEDVLKKRFQGSEEELEKIVKDNRRHPMTYNHYYTSMIQKLRRERNNKRLDECVDGATSTMSRWTSPYQGQAANEHIQITTVDKGKLKSSMQGPGDIADMDEHSCNDVLDCLQAYYKVALKTFTDNIPTQVIERHLIDNLEDIFSPLVVSAWADDVIKGLASEPDDLMRKRKHLEGRKKVLEDGRGVFRRVLSAV